MNISPFLFPKKRCLLSACLFFGLTSSTPTLNAQEVLPLRDLSSFRTTGKTWTVGGSVTAPLSKANELSITGGSGVLANLPGSGGADLFTLAEYGDVDIELDYLMAKGSNSGI